MNIDPIFAERVMELAANSGYFLQDDAGKYYGTQYFYKAYHNCVDNLWLINVGANTGIAGKGAQDVIEWLKSHRYFGGLPKRSWWRTWH